MQRLGIMGGTFDPIHVGHLIAASEALHQFDLDSVTFVPAGQPWQKSNFAGAEDRFLMTVLAAASHPRFRVSRIEIDREGPTYTADTMEAMRSFYDGEVELLFIVGADAALKLGTWVKIERLAELAEVIAVTRPGFELADLSPEPQWPKVHTMEMPLVGISSTDVRRRVREGLPIDYLVPAEVAAHIRRHGLYLGDPVE